MYHWKIGQSLSVLIFLLIFRFVYCGGEHATAINADMGSSTSKLKKKLAKGDECAALVLFDTNKDLQKKFDPNSTYGERYNHDTPLHMASRYALRRALRCASLITVHSLFRLNIHVIK